MSELDKDAVARLIDKCPNPELKEALLVVAKHLGPEGMEDRNETTWPVVDGEEWEEGLGLIFGIYQW